MAYRLLTHRLRHNPPHSLMANVCIMSQRLCFYHDHAALVVRMRFDSQGAVSQARAPLSCDTQARRTQQRFCRILPRSTDFVVIFMSLLDERRPLQRSPRAQVGRHKYDDRPPKTREKRTCERTKASPDRKIRTGPQSISTLTH